MHTRILLLGASALLGASLPVPAAEPGGPELRITVTNTQKRVELTPFPYPAVQQYNLLSATSVNGPYTNDGSAVFAAGAWTSSNNLAQQFYQLNIVPVSSNALLNATLLNRLAYGPTPDELERLATLGPQGYLAEQLAPAQISEPLDTYLSVATNGTGIPPNTNWTFLSVTGTYTNPKLYIYPTLAMSGYIDDIKLQPIYYSNIVSMAGTNLVTNTVPYYGTNLVINGDFESALTPPWTVSSILSGSAISTATASSGARSLSFVSTAGGSTEASSIWQSTVTVPGLVNGSPVRLSYNYLPTPNSSKLTLRMSGNGVVSSADDVPTVAQWIYAEATGVSSGVATFYIYLEGAGTAYIDDLKLVPGSVAGVGANLLANGDFEAPLAAPWQTTANFSNSVVSTTLSHSGTGSLKVAARAGGSGSGNAIIYNNVPGITNLALYTVSFWYLPSENGQPLTVRLSGSGTSGLLTGSPDKVPSGLRRRLDDHQAGITDLRSWFCYNAVASKRQLLEVLSQFWENHFVTQYSKGQDYIANAANNTPNAGRASADLEYREMTRWREAMLNPACAFRDLLKISAESPAMIIYLDTAGSKGNTFTGGNPPTLQTNIANENYAREVLELFCNGVDNGYDQRDIEQMSRTWTGWSVELVNEGNVNNPFAAPSVTYNPGVSSVAKSNIVGVWAFNFKQANHNTNNKYIFFNWNAAGTARTGSKFVPARFGAPWSGRNYSLTVPPATGTNGIRDGYLVIDHLANLPFTMEYLCVKLCRLFVHEDFPNPTTRPELPEYAFYDYTDPNRSEEAELVHQCMLAWENSNPKGQIWPVLNTIFSSALFRGNGAASQKVKTPLEFCASALRALRTANANGTFTATTDGDIATALGRMGSMSLFNRAEPNGYPEAGAPWISAGTLAERLRYLQALLLAGSGDDAGTATSNPVTLLKKKLPAGSWNNAGTVADYFLGILYPGEGAANLSQYRAAAIRFLNTADDATGAGSLFSGLGNTQPGYDTRVRGMVSFLMTLPRFQEQ